MSGLLDRLRARWQQNRLHATERKIAQLSEDRRNLLLGGAVGGALLAIAAEAQAQAPPPVPVLPDTERRTRYSLSAQTGPFNVGFAIYGDSTDFGDWIGVYLNGTLQSATSYTFTSPTGPIATIPRPIADAQITFNSATTGTVDIVGARRPRRTSQFSENRGVAARDLNQVLSDITAIERERWDQSNRIIQGTPGDVFPPFIPGARNSTIVGFDGSGNLIGLPLSSSAITVTAGVQFNTRGLAVAATIGGSIQFVQTAGYATVGDGGQALYAKTGGSTPGGFQSADGAWWKLAIGQIAVPEIYGATGTSDDTATFATAMTALSAAGGGILYLHGNTYLLTSLTVPSQVTIQGPGTLQVKNNANSLNFVVLNGAGAVIRNTTLLGNSANTSSGIGVQIQANDCVVAENDISGFVFTGININSGFRFHIHKNKIHANGSGGIFSDPSSSGITGYGLIEDNAIYSNTLNQGILLGNNHGDIVGVRILGNDVSSNGSGSNVGGGIWLAYPTVDFVIAGNRVYNNNGDNINVAAVGGIIGNNVCEKALGPPGDLENSGIVINSTGSPIAVTDISITNNYCYLNSGTGILVTNNVNHVSIVGNVVRNNSQHTAGNFGGIEVTNIGGTTPSYVVINGNVVHDDQGGGNTQQGIITVNNPTNTIIEGNTVNGNKTNQLVPSTGAGSSAAGNSGYNPVGASAVTPGASPWTYTAGANPETLYVSAATNISSITYGGTQLLPATTAANAAVAISLGPLEAVIVTYSGAATANKMVH